MRALATSLLLLAAPAFADAVDVSLVDKALVGQGMPTVNINILEPIAGFKLTLKRSDGKDVEIKGGGRPGQMRSIELVQPEGKFTYVGELLVNAPNGATSTMPLKFDTELSGPLRMTLEKSDVDIAGRKLRFKLNHAAAKAELKVLMDTGVMAMNGEVMFNGEPAGTVLELSWPEKPGKVMRINVKPYDSANFYTGVEISPWQVDIPHEEVQFDSGKFNIRDSETAKLDKSLGLIQDAVSRYGSLAEIRLFVAGHTDTVGAKDANRTLSLNRARSIGGYFRKKGLRIPIAYEGFGEEALKVGTNDEVDEQQNRRAEYIIAIEDPAVQNSNVKARWQKL